MTSPFLATKLFIPPPAAKWVERPRLAAVLRAGLRPGCRLTLVCAPAGFGKTSLAAAWLRLLGADPAGPAMAWLSLDGRDNDPVAFWRGVIVALQTALPGVGAASLAQLELGPAPDLEACLTGLINELAASSRPLVLVLDDYHHVRSEAIHAALTDFLERLPPHLHLLLLSRTDPPLPLARLRARGQLVEVRMDALRFSVQDAATFLQAGWGLALDGQAVDMLIRKTEGWAAGLQMAALSLHDAAARPGGLPLVEFVDSFNSSNRYVLDYLLEEVLKGQPEDIQRFLIRTSVLDSLCGPLCDALAPPDPAAGLSGGQATLEYLEANNLFILPLDDQRVWYRYHHLFADLLQKRLGQQQPGAAAGLLCRAAVWYEQNQMIPQAIEHALLGGDFARAARLVSQVAEAVWGRGEHATLLRWMEALPAGERQRYPQLWVWQVSMLLTAGRLAEAQACLPPIQAYLHFTLADAPQRRALLGVAHSLQTYLASFHKDYPKVAQLASLALENLPGEANAGARCGILLVLANAQLATGDWKAARGSFEAAICEGQLGSRESMALTGQLNLAILLCLQGEWALAGQVCQAGLERVQRKGLGRSQIGASLRISQGWALAEQGQTELAEALIRQGAELAQERDFIWTIVWGQLALARLLLAGGRLGEAEVVLRQATDLTSGQEIPDYFTSRLVALRALFLAAEGRSEEARRELAGRGICQSEAPVFPHEPGYLALARLNAAQPGGQALDAALEWLSRRARESGQVGLALEVRLLQVQGLAGAGQGELAAAALGEAVDLGEASGALQAFVDRGEALWPLLDRAARAAPRRAYLQRLRAAVGLPTTSVTTAGKMLSPREQEVLELIAQGCANKEIALRMSISLRTVKYHTTQLFTKLGVERRTQAVARGRELGLIEGRG